MNVAEAYIDQRLQLLLYLRNIYENGQRVGNRHLEQVGDGVAVVFHCQRLVVVAAAAADFAEHVNIGQKIHFNAALALALAGFAAATGNVEGKASRFVAALTRLGEHGVDIANGREHARVSCGIRSRGAADRRLIDANYFIDVLRAHDRFVLARLFARPIKLASKCAVKNVIDQRGFTRAGHSGNDSHDAERERYIEILEIVFFRAENSQRRAVLLPTLSTHLDLYPAGDVCPGQRVGLAHDFFRRSVGDQASAVASGTGAEVDYVIGAANCLFVVLYHQHSVAQVAQVLERGKQAAVVAMMQADRWLVQHVEHAAQFRANLCGETDALAFTAGKSRRRAVERNVVQPHRVQELQALHHFMHNAAGNLFFAASELNGSRNFKRL